MHFLPLILDFGTDFFLVQIDLHLYLDQIQTLKEIDQTNLFENSIQNYFVNIV